MISRGVTNLREFAENRRAEKVETGIASFDRMTGGLVKGGICEVSGEDGAGKRGLAVSLLASAAVRNGLCAVVDGTDGFDPVSAEENGAVLEKTLWVRCGGDVTKAIMSAEHLVQSRLFEIVWLDLGGFSEETLNSLPGSYWYKFKVGLQGARTTLVVTAGSPRVRSAAHQSLRLSKEKADWSGAGNFRLAERVESRAECLRPSPGIFSLSLVCV